MLPQKVTRNSCPLGSDLMYESKGTDSLTTCGPGEESPDHHPKSVSPVPALHCTQKACHLSPVHRWEQPSGVATIRDVSFLMKNGLPT